MTKAAGYIATNRDETTIYGIGDTADDAFADAINWADELDAFPVFPATQGLLDRVSDYGGIGMAWDKIDGVCCLEDEG